MTSDEERRAADENDGAPLHYSPRTSEPPQSKGSLLSPARLTQLVIELIFLMLGALVMWLGASGRIYIEDRRHSILWLAISIGVMLWGLLALAKPGQWWMKWQKWNRGGSLVVLGLLMVAISRVPFLWVGKLLTVCGVVLILRGILGSVLILKPR